MLNDKVLPFFEANELPVLRILTDRGTEYCGRVEQHVGEFALADTKRDKRASYDHVGTPLDRNHLDLLV